ncbi:hypothetical protein V1477_005231 [Vespula maculifrons]|uniref:Uncharacterized protein n=1 Tax=Vespula maculifrons TaxID=7453 RepID=A0ABD2CP31_VESMC
MTDSFLPSEVRISRQEKKIMRLYLWIISHVDNPLFDATLGEPSTKSLDKISKTLRMQGDLSTQTNDLTVKDKTKGAPDRKIEYNNSIERNSNDNDDDDDNDDNDDDDDDDDDEAEDEDDDKVDKGR